MIDQQSRLVRSHHYCTDRLREVTGELLRLRTERNQIKANSDKADEAMIRRRTYVERRVKELQIEGMVLTAELQGATDRLRTENAMAGTLPSAVLASGLGQ